MPTLNYPVTQPRRTAVGLGNLFYYAYAVKHKQSGCIKYITSRRLAWYFYRLCADMESEQEFINLYKATVNQ